MCAQLMRRDASSGDGEADGIGGLLSTNRNQGDVLSPFPNSRNVSFHKPQLIATK